MTDSTSKKYDLDLDEFIIKELSERNIGYRILYKLIGENYRPISFETFNRHVKHLKDSGWIDKDAKYAPYQLTERCKQRLRLNALNLISPRAVGQPASKKIDIYVLLLLFKLDSSYEFEQQEELDYFLSVFGLTTDSFILKMQSDALHRSGNKTYMMSTFESVDSRITLNKRAYLSLPYTGTLYKSTSFICFIKGVTYPLTSYRTDPFKKAGITQDEIKYTHSLLSEEDILQKPVEYLNDSVYLAVDIHLYNLLSLYSYLYDVCRSTLKELWSLREPTEEEIQWLRRIERDSKVTRFIVRTKEKRKKRTYYERQKRLANLIKKINNTKNVTLEEKKYRRWLDGLPKTGGHEPTTKDWIEKQYQEIRSNPKYQFIISEIEKFAFPHWFQRMRKNLAELTDVLNKYFGFYIYNFRFFCIKTII